MYGKCTPHGGFTRSIIVIESDRTNLIACTFLGAGLGHNRRTAERAARQHRQCGLRGGRRRREAHPARHHGSRAHVRSLLSKSRAYHSPGRYIL